MRLYRDTKYTVHKHRHGQRAPTPNLSVDLCAGLFLCGCLLYGAASSAPASHKIQHVRDSHNPSSVSTAATGGPDVRQKETAYARCNWQRVGTHAVCGGFHLLVFVLRTYMKSSFSIPYSSSRAQDSRGPGRMRFALHILVKMHILEDMQRTLVSS